MHFCWSQGRICPSAFGDWAPTLILLLLSDGMGSLSIAWPPPEVPACALGSVLRLVLLLEGCCQGAFQQSQVNRTNSLQKFTGAISTASLLPHPLPQDFFNIQVHFFSFPACAFGDKATSERGWRAEQSVTSRRGTELAAVHRCQVSAAPLNTPVWGICPKLLRSVYKPNNDRPVFS